MEVSAKAFQNLLALVESLRQEIVELKCENRMLKERIHELEHPKNSSNSSIPPSQDENRIPKNQSLRVKSGKLSGGQSGHKGHHLKMVEIPDYTVEHIPTACSQCGSSLHDVEPAALTRRQVVELPVVQPVYTEHKGYTKVCRCGHVNRANFPEGVVAPIQYGAGIENLVAYLNVAQYLPYKRIAAMLQGLFNLSLSQGSIKSMMDRVALRSAPIYEKIRQELETALVVGADETGARLNGHKWWLWVWQNAMSTYIAASDNRAFRTVESNFPNGFVRAALVSDRYAAHQKTAASSHQVCTSHLFRDLEYLIELSGSQRAIRFKFLLHDALYLKSIMAEEDCYQVNLARSFIRQRTFKLLEECPTNEHKKLKAFFKKMSKCKDYIYEFLYNHHVPPDNNGSERAIRNVKVKQKVSTFFKSEQGIKNYAIIRSVIDTCTKRKINFLDAEKLIFTL
jgi:transposase